MEITLCKLFCRVKWLSCGRGWHSGGETPGNPGDNPVEAVERAVEDVDNICGRAEPDNYGKPPVMGESEKKVGKTVENARCPPEQKRGLTRRGKCGNIYPAVKEQFAGIAQSVEQLIRNQQVVCSSHITSSIPGQRKLCPGIFSMLAGYKHKTRTS